MKSYLLILFVTLIMSVHTVSAHDADNNVNRKILTTTALPNLPKHSLTSVTVELPPGKSVPSHYHQGFVFAYVLSGTVLSQLNQEAAVEYHAGDSWIEKPGDQHSLTKNPSNVEPAKILAVFVAKSSAKLTTFGNIAR